MPGSATHDFLRPLTISTTPTPAIPTYSPPSFPPTLPRHSRLLSCHSRESGNPCRKKSRNNPQTQDLPGQAPLVTLNEPVVMCLLVVLCLVRDGFRVSLRSPGMTQVGGLPGITEVGGLPGITTYLIIPVIPAKAGIHIHRPSRHSRLLTSQSASPLPLLHTPHHSRLLSAIPNPSVIPAKAGTRAPPPRLFPPCRQ